MTATTLELEHARSRAREKRLRAGLSIRRRRVRHALSVCWGWALVLAWGPIAAWRMSRTRSPHELGPERWND